MMNRKRRNFLKQQLLLGTCLAAGFDVINAPANAADTSGYKALVCVYLAGGNDSYNMFIPTTASAHADYADARQFLAVPRNQILPVSPVSYSDGLNYGFHPQMPETQRLFGEGELSVIANVGSLIRPITKQEYEERSTAVPRHLFSHNDQTDSWLAADARGAMGEGWAGRMMDILYPTNAPKPSPSISIGGSSIWQRGRRVRALQMGTNGFGQTYLPWHSAPIKLRDAYTAMYSDAVNESNLFVNENAMTLERARDFANQINSAIQNAPEYDVAFPEGNRLGDQLKMVANLIAVRNELDANMNRQVFFVRIGGWDTHDAQISNEAAVNHPKLLKQLDLALNSFQRAMIQLGLNDSVTTFTATEFGRSLTPNGTGTDHGWGGHAVVMGGAVQGGDIFGRMPQVSRDSPDTVANNRFIPGTGVEEMCSIMAGWFGCSPSELNQIFPNLSNFPQQTTNLEFVI